METKLAYGPAVIAVEHDERSGMDTAVHEVYIGTGRPTSHRETIEYRFSQMTEAERLNAERDECPAPWEPNSVSGTPDPDSERFRVQAEYLIQDCLGSLHAAYALLSRMNAKHRADHELPLSQLHYWCGRHMTAIEETAGRKWQQPELERNTLNLRNEGGYYICPRTGKDRFPF